MISARIFNRSKIRPVPYERSLIKGYKNVTRQPSTKTEAKERNSKAEILTLTPLSSRLNANNMGTCALGNFPYFANFYRESIEKPRRKKERNYCSLLSFSNVILILPMSIFSNKRNITLIIIPALLCGPKKENQTFHQSLYNKLISSWLVCELALHFELQAKRDAREHAAS